MSKKLGAIAIPNREVEPGLPRWVPMIANDGSTKGARTTISVVSRHGRSPFAFYQGDLVKGNPTQWSLHHRMRARPKGYRGVACAMLETGQSQTVALLPHCVRLYPDTEIQARVAQYFFSDVQGPVAPKRTDVVA